MAYGHTEAVMELCNARAKANLQTSETLSTPLHLAIENGHYKTAFAFAKWGKEVNVNIQDANGNTPMHLVLTEYSRAYRTRTASIPVVEIFDSEDSTSSSNDSAENDSQSAAEGWMHLALALRMWKDASLNHFKNKSGKKPIDMCINPKLKDVLLEQRKHRSGKSSTSNAEDVESPQTPRRKSVKRDRGSVKRPVGSIKRPSQDSSHPPLVHSQSVATTRSSKPSISSPDNTTRHTGTRDELKRTMSTIHKLALNPRLPNVSDVVSTRSPKSPGIRTAAGHRRNDSHGSVSIHSARVRNDSENAFSFSVEDQSVLLQQMKMMELGDEVSFLKYLLKFVKLFFFFFFLQPGTLPSLSTKTSKNCLCLMWPSFLPTLCRQNDPLWYLQKRSETK